MAKDTGGRQPDVAQQIWALAAAMPLPLRLLHIALESISELSPPLSSHNRSNLSLQRQPEWCLTQNTQL